MHDVLRQRLLRRLESLPEAQLYQVLDYVEFLESKYGETPSAEISGLQRFAENIEDTMRKKAMNPATLREAFQVIAAADKVLSNVSNAGKQLLNDLVPEDESLRRPSAPGPTGERPRPGPDRARAGDSRPDRPRDTSRDASGGAGRNADG